MTVLDFQITNGLGARHGHSSDRAGAAYGRGYFDLTSDDFANSKEPGVWPNGKCPIFSVALISSIVVAIGTGSRVGQFQKIGSVPLWLLIAGVMSAGMIIGSSYLIPKIGIGAFFVLLVSGQVLAGMVFGYFGLFGVPASALTIGKGLGALLVIAGVFLVTFR